jgi:cytidyltransferase-like protein
MKKIINFKDIKKIADEIRSSGKIIGLCHGTFDLLHIGHLKHFQEASRIVDILFVSLTGDNFVNKAPGRPVFNENLRSEFIAELECIDFVVIVPESTGVSIIELLKPEYYFKGEEYKNLSSDMTGKIKDEIEALKLFGGKIYFTSDIVFSSSKLINEKLNILDQQTANWLTEFKNKYDFSDVKKWIDAIEQISVTIFGEAIIDEYTFCSGLGKAAKDPILAFLYEDNKRLLGGSLAIANHAATFCNNVNLICMLSNDEHEVNFIKKNLNSKISLNYVVQDLASVITKKRFVDIHTSAKIFELYQMKNNEIDSITEKNLIQMLSEIITSSTLTIVPDYGHGLISDSIINFLCKQARFLAVNTQTNAGNRGFNHVSKYLRSDYISIAGHELELEMRKRHGNHVDMLVEFSKRINCEEFTLTLGKSGSLHYQKSSNEIFQVPSFAAKVVDRVGAGDAVLTITSMLHAIAAPIEIIGLVGNVAGAQMVEHLGNMHALDKGSLLKRLQSLLK